MNAPRTPAGLAVWAAGMACLRAGMAAAEIDMAAATGMAERLGCPPEPACLLLAAMARGVNAEMVASRQAFLRPFRNGGGYVWCLKVQRAQGTGRRRTRLVAGGLTEVATSNRRGREAWAQGLLAQGFVPMFLLMRQVRMVPRFDMAARVAEWAGRVPGLMDEAMGRMT